MTTPILTTPVMKSERRKQKDNARAAKATPAVPAGPPAPPAVIPHVSTSPARQLLQAILPALSLHPRNHHKIRKQKESAGDIPGNIRERGPRYKQVSQSSPVLV